MIRGGSVLLLGPPGSGKGTQSALLARKYSVPHVSLGEILRAHVQLGGEFSTEARPYLAAGVSVPVPLMSQVLRKRLSDPDMSGGFIGDGLVRTVEQARELNTILANLSMNLQTVFHIQLSREEILRRTRNRVWCPRCGASYNTDSLSSDSPRLCHADNDPLVRRPDDSENIVEHRIRTHEESLPAIVAYYQSRGILREIDGARPIALVHADIAAVCANRYTANRLPASG